MGASMTPEKLDQWLYKPCPGGVTLQLAHGQVGPTPDLVVASWTREEVQNARECGISHADTIYSEAQDHADSVGESCKFLIQWMSENGRPLRSIVHRVAPSEPTNNVYAANADAVSTNAMIAQFLGHIHQQQKLVNGNMGTVCSAFERAMNMQNAMLVQMTEMLKSQRRELTQLQDRDSSAETTELTKLKTRAFEKLIELGPDVARVFLASVGGLGAGDADTPQHVNGVDHSGEAAA